MPRRVHLEPATQKLIRAVDARGRPVQVDHRELEEILEKNFRKIQQFINQVADELAALEARVTALEGP